MSDRDEFYRQFSRSYDKLHQSEKQDDLVERVALAICEDAGMACHCKIACAICKVDARAAIALVLEEAAKVADDEACHWEDTGSAPSDFGNAGRNDAARTIAAAIRAMIKKEE